MNNILLSILKKILTYYSRKIIEDVNVNMVGSLFLNTIIKHRLEGRIDISGLFDMQETSFLSREIKLNLVYRKCMINLMYCKQLKAITDLNKRFQAKGIEEIPLIIKGITIFGVTNNSSNLRRSHDIDIMYNNLPLLEDILTEMGYEKVITNVEHEYCSMIKDEIIFELHRFLPVVSYTDEVVKKMDKAYIGDFNLFFETNVLNKEEILYEELNRDAQGACHLNGIKIPNRYQAVMILSSHIFRNYVNSQFQFSSHIIIAELLDVIDLLDEESFSCVNLLELIKVNKSVYCSFLFVAYLLKEVCNYNRLIVLLKDSDFKYNYSVFPKFLQWSGALYIPSDPNEFIYYGMSEFIEKLNPEIIQITNDNIDAKIIDINKYNSHGLEIIKYLSIRKENSKLVIDATLWKLNVGLTCDVFEIFINDYRCCFTIEEYKIKTEEKPEGCSWKLKKCRDIIEIELPIELFKPMTEKVFSFVFSVTRWGTGPVSTFLPIRIQGWPDERI